MSVEPEDFTGRIICMSMFNDISWGSKDNEQECELSAKLVSICAKRYSPGRWSFLGPGSVKKWYSICDSRPQGEWDRVAELMMLKISASGHPVFRAHEYIVPRNAQKQRWWKPMEIRLKLFFAQLYLSISSVFTEQSQTCEKNTNLAMLEQGDLFW